MYLPVELSIRTDIENFFYRSFSNDLPFPLPVFYYNRHSSACKVERYFIHFGIVVLQMFQIQFSHMGKDCFIHQVSQTSLKIAVKVRMTKNTFTVIIAPICVDILLQHNFVTGQRTGLIGAEYIHRSKILDSIEVLYNCFLL